MRFVGKSRLGFYPLPLCKAQRVRGFLQFPDVRSSALDPCIGDGVALEAITTGAQVLRYGIELDAYRAEQASERIPNIVQGNTFGSAVARLPLLNCRGSRSRRRVGSARKGRSLKQRLCASKATASRSHSEGAARVPTSPGR